MRRFFPLLALLAVAFSACWWFAANSAAKSPENQPVPNATNVAPAKPIDTLYLFVHCSTGEWDQPETRDAYLAKWRELLSTVGSTETSAVCFLSSGEESKEVAAYAQQFFSDRCFVDPDDNSDATKVLIAEDVFAACKQRGNLREWTAYEMWTSINARRWSEGLKRELAARGYTYHADLKIVSCGQMWGGCLTKYSSFMATYLGLNSAPETRPDLSPYAGFPLAATYRETLPLAGHVRAYLFETKDGRPMVQFMEGLRGVSAPPHLAQLGLTAAQVEIVETVPNGFQRPLSVPSTSETSSLTIDVGDGCRPIITTVLAKGLSYADFRTAVAQAKITELAKPARVFFHPTGCTAELCPTYPQETVAK
jgi:hypothetical protein